MRETTRNPLIDGDRPAGSRRSGVVLSLNGIRLEVTGTEGERIVLVDGIDVQIAASQAVCLAGRSGVGKSSLIRVAAGLAEPTAGEVVWRGAPADGRQRQAWRRDNVGYQDQSSSLLEELTVWENVTLPAHGDGTRDVVDRAEWLLEELHIASLADARPHRLSGGERQRVALARTLLMRRALVLLDEPTASLDRESADRVLALLSRERDEGTAILTASHDEAVMAWADHVVRLS